MTTRILATIPPSASHATTCLLAIALLLAAAMIPRPVLAGSCDGFANHADELAASAFTLESETILPGGISEVELSFELANLDVADFASARAFPTLGAAALALGIETIDAEAGFGPVSPLGVATSTSNLRLRLPSANVATLLAELSAGALAMTVHAEEQNVLAPGVALIDWSANEDAYYAIARDTSRSRSWLG